MSRFIQIDEEGYFLSGEARITDEYYGRSLLENLKIDGRVFVTQAENTPVLVEAFDEPFVAHRVEKNIQNFKNFHWYITMPYGFSVSFPLESLVLDEWDRFHGRAENGVPFVLSRPAQMQLFDLVDSFDDDSITVSGRQYKIPNLISEDKKALEGRADINTSDFWTESYQTWNSTGDAPKWDLGTVAKPLAEVVPQIKIPRSKICIFGCGTGHDAAYLASLGHIVIAVDISEPAIEKARSLNPETANLKYICADAFEFARKHRAEFDLIFEHTFFCAIDPDRRGELISAWNNMLTEYGHLLGIFFTFDRAGGPPFSASEWELRERLKKNFEFLYWTRWKTSLEDRLGKELVVYARKRLM